MLMITQHQNNRHVILKGWLYISLAQGDVFLIVDTLQSHLYRGRDEGMGACYLDN